MNDKWINRILKSNKNKSFVKRILSPEKYGSISNEDGTTSTHLMSWGESDGKYVVFPTILMGDDGALHKLDPGVAFDQVRKTRNFIEFDSAKEAEFFSKNYKRFWESDFMKK